MASDVYVGRIRSVVLILLLCGLTLGVYFFVWLYQINLDLRRHLNQGVNPLGRLLLFLLPVIGWGLATWWIARDIRRIQLDAGAEPVGSPLYPTIWSTLVPVVGWFISAGYLQEGANRTWLKMRDTLTTGGMPSLLECPDCDTRFSMLLNPLMSRAIACPRCGRAGDV